MDKSNKNNYQKLHFRKMEIENFTVNQRKSEEDWLNCLKVDYDQDRRMITDIYPFYKSNTH